MQDKEDLKEAPSEGWSGGKIPDSQEAISEQNKAIYDILMMILQKWQAGRVVKKGAEEEDLTETTIISAGGPSKISSCLPTQDKRDDLPETIIISPATTKKHAFKTASQSQPKESEPEDKTIINQASIKSRLLKKEGKKVPDQDFLTETVILKSRKKVKLNDDDKK